MKWNLSSTYTSACERREGIFESMPTDVIQVLKLGVLPTNIADVLEHGEKLIVPTSLGLAVVAEMAWFAQHTRTVDAYDTNGSVDKHGIEICAESYRRSCWNEKLHWLQVLSEIGKRYKLSPELVNELRVASCNLFSRRRLGKRGYAFPVILACSIEKRAIWIDIAYQGAVFSNICPFVTNDVIKLDSKQRVCFTCKKVCKNKCGKCKITPYCNKECQKKDYEEHKKVCTAARQVEALGDIFQKTKDVRHPVPSDINYYLVGFNIHSGNTVG